MFLCNLSKVYMCIYGHYIVLTWNFPNLDIIIIHTHVGRPRPLSGALEVTIMDRTVTFRWNYDNSVNGVPATKFVLNVTRSGGPNVREMLNIDQRQHSISSNDLASNQSYTVAIAVRNLQGDSDIISNTFRSPGMDCVQIRLLWWFMTILLSFIAVVDSGGISTSKYIQFQ